MSEKSAIAVCCILVALLTVPILVVIQILSTLVWSVTMVVRLIEGEGVFDDEDELVNYSQYEQYCEPPLVSRELH